jgi:hypothetical protein
VKKKKKQQIKWRDPSQRPNPRKQPSHPLLPKTHTRTSKTKPDHQGATPISNLPEIPTHSPQIPARDPKAKAHAKHAPRSNCQSKPNTTVEAPVTAPPIRHHRSRFVTRLVAPLAWVSPAGRDPPQPNSKHTMTPLKSTLNLDSNAPNLNSNAPNPFLMPQNSFLMPQNSFFDSNLKPRSRKLTH